MNMQPSTIVNTGWMACGLWEHARVHASSGTLITIAGKGVAGCSGDGGPATSAESAFVVVVTTDRAGPAVGAATHRR